MNIRYLLVVFFLGAVFTVKAQDYDLNNLRQAPKKNSLPVRAPKISIRDVDIEDPNLNLKINYWRNWTSFSINANQASFSDSWNSGGVNSISLGAFFNTKWDYTKEDKNFVSELDLRYGKIKNENQLARKNQDRIWWDNKYSIKFSQKWALFAALTFETQFDAGWQYTNIDGVDTKSRKISNFMAPGYLTPAVGLEYKPDQFSSIRFGPATRMTYILDDRVQSVKEEDTTRFGVEIPGRFKNDVSFQLLAGTDRDLTKWLHLKTTYEFLANFEELSTSRHRLDASLGIRISRVMSLLFNATLLYDPNQIQELQRSQSIGIGLNYKFPR